MHNVNNIPLDTIYRFDINKYVYTTMLKGTRYGPSVLKKPITEVFEISNEGNIHFLASGELVENGGMDNYTRGFTIRDFNKKEMIGFRVTMYLHEVSNDEISEICEEVAINHKKSK